MTFNIHKMNYNDHSESYDHKKLNIFCPIHGIMEITHTIRQILDTPEVQRLRDIKQLGATYYVFPSATHSRLEHSLGVSFLAGEVGHTLQKKHPELNITNRFIELLKIAGLVHDIGHGPYSHLYDNYVRLSSEPEHEERGLKIFEELCIRENIRLNCFEKEEIQKMINPTGNDIYNWKYQIIANKSCQIDVDKIDYIERDSFHLGISHSGELKRLLKLIRIGKTQNDNYELIWDYKAEFDVYSLFSTRYRLHRQVYTHHTVRAFEHVIIDILKKIKKTSTKPLYHYSDSIVTQYCYDNPDEPICQSLMTRNHPHYLGQVIVKNHEIPIKYNGFHLIGKGLILEEIRIGFVSGNTKKNPLKCVFYYEERKNGIVKTFQISSHNSSFLITDKFQERIIRGYYISDFHESLTLWKKIKKEYLMGKISLDHST